MQPLIGYYRTHPADVDLSTASTMISNGGADLPRSSGMHKRPTTGIEGAINYSCIFCTERGAGIHYAISGGLFLF